MRMSVVLTEKDDMGHSVACDVTVNVPYGSECKSNQDWHRATVLTLSDSWLVDGLNLVIHFEDENNGEYELIDDDGETVGAAYIGPVIDTDETLEYDWPALSDRLKLTRLRRA